MYIKVILGVNNYTLNKLMMKIE